MRVLRGSRYPFLTEKERDIETGLDYFLARYYSATQDRFTTPDIVGGSRLNPQSLNLYSYVQNNPLRYIDPTGHFQVDPYTYPWQIKQDQKRPIETKPKPNVPEGYEIKEDGSLARKGGGAVVRETVEVTAKRGLFSRFFRRVGGFFSGPIGGLFTYLSER